MKQLLIAAIVALPGFAYSTSPLLFELRQVEEGLTAFDPIRFAPITVDIYHVVMTNPNLDPVALQAFTTPIISIDGNFIRQAKSAELRESVDAFSVLGPNIVPNSWLVAPPGVSVEPGICICLPDRLDLSNTDTDRQFIGDEFLPAFGSATIAVLSAPAGATDVLESVSGQAFVGGVEVGFLLVPEASTALLAWFAVWTAGSRQRRVR